MEINIRDGYKVTEVGVIPDDWEVKMLVELGYSGRPAIKAGPFGSSLKKEFYVEKGYKIYGQEQVIAGDLAIGNYYIDSYLFEKLKSCEIRPNDILISLVGTFGKVIVVPDNIERGIINPRLLRLSLNTNLVYSYFLQYWLISSTTQKLLSETSHGGTMGIINAKVLSVLSIPLPPLAEQKAIAHALSDVDNLITAIDQLITKKRNIKQGTMQELLTGKKRLPGFSGKWEVKKLGDILKVKHGKSQHNIIDENGKFPILATGGEIGKTNTYLYNKPSVLIGRKGTIDIPQYMDTPFWTIDTLFYTEIFNNAVPKFVFYKFNLINWYSYNEASGVPSLNAKTIENIDINFPKNVLEQKAIAEILTDIDKEIEALEKNRDKYKALKQGMMQELLTGKTRIIDN
jgi:type I restriction enzyme S subunit